MKKTICDKCKIGIDERATNETMAHITDSTGHVLDLCDSCFDEYHIIYNEASKQFNATIQAWVDSWRLPEDVK